MNAPQSSFASATPPLSPLRMPTQNLARDPRVVFRPSSASVSLARVVVFGGAILLTLYGYRQMTLVFGNEFRSALEWLLLVLFTVTFAWIAFSATQAIAALFTIGAGPPEATGRRLHSRTALLMPVYNEDAAETVAALAAMGKGLARLGQGHRVEIFIISDTRDPQVWVQETAAFHWLRTMLAGEIAVWYRRRRENTARKAGNVREFVERYGGRYDYMLVLDADSLMTPETMAEMIRRMDGAPRLGILQTVPMLEGGTTLFARLQQFASALYGGVIARGVAAWQGQDGNYWGHNALIRVRAWADACGLPELPGAKPFGGDILSHDFVEAALIRRRGWDVRMDPDLGGSFEGSPPSLIDLAVRDRRWAQGNLQHAKVVGAAGLRLPSRIHFLNGIAAYSMSPIWLMFLLVGAALTLQTLLVEPTYFSLNSQLFPSWPVFDAERMAWLFALAMGLLLLPKVMGLVWALCDGRMRKRFGGPLRLVAGAATELLLSALYAPVLMLLQVRHLWEILTGGDSGWSQQKRSGGALPLRAAVGLHRWHVLFGLIPLLVWGWWASEQLIWLFPVIAGLVLAPILSSLSGSVGAGRILRRVGLLVTPEERRRPPVAVEAERLHRAAAAAAAVDVVAMASNDVRLSQHVSTLGAGAGGEGDSEASNLAMVTARAKIEAADCPHQALSWMTAAEKISTVGSAELLHLLAERTGRARFSA